MIVPDNGSVYHYFTEYTDDLSICKYFCISIMCNCTNFDIEYAHTSFLIA